jgi:hypothetical protein
MAKVTKDASFWIVLNGPNPTVGDLRELMLELDALRVPDHSPLEDCIVSFNYHGDVEYILDAESSPMSDKYDILLPLVFKDENT